MLKKLPTLILFLPLLLSSCSFRSPSLAAQKELLKQGAFPAGTPSWIATPRVGISSVAERSTTDGMFRRSYAREAGKQEDEGILSKKYTQIENDRLKKTEAEGVVDEKKNLSLAKSPIDRILSVCPKVESDITAALQTINLNERIKKYESLVNRCPLSWDLWLWLGKDYETNKQLVQAGRCYDKVLMINPGNQEANDLADANRKFLNSRPVAK